jgi:aminopeptidase-like protein
MLQIIKNLLFKNRTIVSSDVSDCIDMLCEKYPLTIHQFPTDSEYQTWIIPPEWNVRKAILSDGKKVVASYEESPLFLAPYSIPFSGMVTRDELIEHTFTNPDKPEAFCYEFRLACNYQRRLKEWRISLPYQRLLSLSEGPFFIDIDVEIRPGNMLIAEYMHPGRSGYWVSLLAHYCHIAQANDGLAGVAVMLEVIDRIKQSYPNPRHGYKALLMPETIGSSVYAATHLPELDNTLCGIFSEMPGADEPLQFVFSRNSDTYIDRIFLYVLHKHGKNQCRYVQFRNGWGNDELVFDAPGIGVPSVSIDRHPFHAYHTHYDNLELVKLSRLEEVVDILLDVVDIMERDYIPRPRNRIPVYLTRFDLYADWSQQRAQYDINTMLLDSMWSGYSAFDISLQNNLDIDVVLSYFNKFVHLNLIDSATVTPDYCRSIRFLPSFFKA